MKIKIETIYGISSRTPVAYEIHPDFGDASPAEQVLIKKSSTDIETLQALAKDIEENRYLDRSKVFVRVCQESLAYHERFQRWKETFMKLNQSYKDRYVLQIGSDVKDNTLEQRWDALKDFGVDLAISEFGTAQSRLERLRKYNWRYCDFDAHRTMTLKDSAALMICKIRKIKPIARKVSNQSQSLLAILSGQDWQQGVYPERIVSGQSFDVDLGAAR